MESSATLNTFRVIIAGGAVAGLTLANALDRAGIDFVLLEKRDVAPNVGQSILVLPCTALVFEQLGLNKTLDEVCVPLRMREHWDSRMKKFCASDELWLLYQKAKRPARFIDRYRFLKSMYDGIKDKSKIRSREGLVSFIETPDGVTVRTDKDNVYEGSILIGADGVHSEVRNQIAALIAGHDPKSAHILTKGFKTRYACLTATSWNHFADDPRRQLLADGIVNNSYHEKERIGGISSPGVPAREGQPGQLFWSAYIPLDVLGKQPCAEYPSPRFNQSDLDTFIKKYGHLKLCPDYTFNDCYRTLIGASIICMEENVLPTRWNSGGRVMLLGDAVHKATANLGMGGNLCVDAVCRLMNGLLPLLQRTGDAPSTQQLTKLFDGCERQGRSRAKFVYYASSFFCGFETMSSWYAHIVKWTFPLIPSSLKMQVFAIFDGGAPKLDFLPVPKAEFKE
ncbi:hypothetical protein N0V82_006411 [Gnomoniopsis sp. IMI 355080]|nr:hypothetical protein N0V82_006411 [Gnomoniopsis sp. IMI 355080]